MKKKKKALADASSDNPHIIRLMVFVFFLALFINTQVITTAYVPTGSMENTVMEGDKLYVLRAIYWFEKPKRGDIIMFKFPDDESEQFLKRIIGLPGETVMIRDGLVYINDIPMPLNEPYIKDAPEGTWGPYEVPTDHYFCLGDNRDVSMDSRLWNNKYVARDKIIGRAVFVYSPKFKFLSSPVY